MNILNRDIGFFLDTAVVRTLIKLLGTKDYRVNQPGKPAPPTIPNI